MDPREKDMLKRALELSEQNNEMLRGMRRSMRIGMIFKVVYWLIVIGLAVGAYYFIQPFFDQVIDSYYEIQTSLHEADGLFDKAKTFIPGGE